MNHFPVEITKEAWQHILALMKRKAKTGDHFRIGVKGGGCSGFEYLFAVESRHIEGDLFIEKEGLKVVCDPKSATILMGSKLYKTKSLLGNPLNYDNPNVVRSCGCGSSFSLKPKQ